jgi:hypothetical protein
MLVFMKSVSETEMEVMNRLASVEFEGVVQLRAQIATISLVEPNCVCGCPSFTPVIDRSVAPASPLRAVLPTELVVIWFADAEGYITNVECVYYDDALPEWPDPRQCTIRG